MSRQELICSSSRTCRRGGGKASGMRTMWQEDRFSSSSMKNTPVTLRIAMAALSGLPHSILYYLGTVGGSIHYLLARRKRKHYKDTVSFAASANGKKPHFRKAFQNHALNVLEIIKAPTEPASSIKARVTFFGLENVDRALNQGKGLLLATCHLGNWELAGLAMALRGSRPWRENSSTMTGRRR
jgi:lauroyl/myristoyl acyltransferase